jgi:hypothetical protein
MYYDVLKIETCVSLPVLTASTLVFDVIERLCLGKVIEESASTCVAVGMKAFSISNSWLFDAFC